VSCIVAFYPATAGADPSPQIIGQTETTAAASADALYAQRVDIAKAKQAIDIWQHRSADGKDYDSLWKLSRADYYLGTAGPKDEQSARLESGITVGKQAAALQPDKPEGHFWYAANMGEKAQRSSKFTALGLKGDIKSELERVIGIHPGWQGGSGESALGEWYLKVPDTFMCCGGDHKKGIELLRKALTYDPESKQVKYSLAEALSDDDKTRPEARTLLQQVLDAPIDPEWAAEDQGFKKKSADLLAKLNRK
jgi:tetratricopeptide (TPR) repeat protein